MSAELEIKDDIIVCRGRWTRAYVNEIEYQLSNITLPSTDRVTIDGAQITHFDTAGGVLLLRLLQYFAVPDNINWQNFTSPHLTLIDLLQAQDVSIYESPPEPPSYTAIIGQNTLNCVSETQHFLRFTGEATTTFLLWIRLRSRIRWSEIASGIQLTGYDAMPIVGLLAFLIGIVLTYQLGNQLSTYGANIYVVDLLGIAILREFAPLMTAIILAGRTGSAYTAQIGTMVLNEEVDAIRTLGLYPAEILVLPKVIALVIALPLLVVLANIFGICGGMIMSKSMLDIGYVDFLKRFGSVIEARTFFVGMVKTPFFALLISTVGCFHGFQVRGGALSIGQRTTRSVVHSIFFIIVADAGFSILFSAVGL